MIRIAALPGRLALQTVGCGVSVTLILCGVFATVTPAAAKPKPGPTGACFEVARDTRRACEHGAQDEFWIAIGRCDNASSDAGADHGANSCRRSALEDQKSALQSCREQLSARNDVCTQLGGGPYTPQIDPGDFSHSTRIDNAYLTLEPGTTFHYRSNTAGGVELDDVTVTHETRNILGVDCVVVHDVVRLHGELTEDTIDWYAQDDAGNVWYFGEEAKQYANGILVGNDGSWIAGVDDAFPGVVMKASPTPGDFYRQEFAIGEAEDVAQVEALGQTVSVPYGSFSDALQTKEFSAMEPAAVENKYYVPGVGFVLSIDLETGERQELVRIAH